MWCRPDNFEGIREMFSLRERLLRVEIILETEWKINLGNGVENETTKIHIFYGGDTNVVFGALCG